MEHTEYHTGQNWNRLCIEQIESTIREIHWSISEYIVFKRIVYKTGTHKIQESSVIKVENSAIKCHYKGKQLSENI